MALHGAAKSQDLPSRYAWPHVPSVTPWMHPILDRPMAPPELLQLHQAGLLGHKMARYSSSRRSPLTSTHNNSAAVRSARLLVSLTAVVASSTVSYFEKRLRGVTRPAS